MLLVFIAFIVIINFVRANTYVSIEVKDSNGNSIVGQTVPINTVAYVYGHYEGSGIALATMKVSYDDDPNSGPGWRDTVVLFQGYVANGSNTTRSYTLTKAGYYNFTWICQTSLTDTKAETKFVSATVGFVIPEPGALAGITMAISAFVFLAAFKKLKLPSTSHQRLNN